MCKIPPSQLDTLVQQVLSSPKYRTVCKPVIRNIGRHELTVRRSLKEAVKGTRNTLHQVAGAYIAGRMRYTEWEAELHAHAHNPDQFREACARILRYHASTRERLEILPVFYSTILGSIPPPSSILDIGCGLNPLTIPWMPILPDARIYAVDLYTDQMAFLNRFFSIAGYSGQAQAHDIAASPPTHRADVALVLKVLPLMQHLPHADSLSLLKNLNVDYIVVSFPAYSLGGKEKGMAQHYETWFLKQVQEEPWRITRFAFATELAFLVEKKRTTENAEN